MEDKKFREKIAKDLTNGLKDITILRKNEDGSMDVRLTTNIDGKVYDMLESIWLLYEANAADFGIVIHDIEFKKRFLSSLSSELRKYVQ